MFKGIENPMIYHEKDVDLATLDKGMLLPCPAFIAYYNNYLDVTLSIRVYINVGCHGHLTCILLVHEIDL